MTSFFQNSINNFKKNPNKIFFHSLESQLSGFDCYNNLNKILKFLKKKNIRSIGICLNNNIYWPLWYLAADKFCKDIYVLNPSFSQRLINQIQLRYKINAIVQKIHNINNISLNSIKIKKFKEKFIKNKFQNNILFTSGTSDLPKGVIVSKSAYMHVARILVKNLSQKKSDLELLSMPFNHSFGLTRLRCVLLSGSSALISDGLKNFPEIYHFSK